MDLSTALSMFEQYIPLDLHPLVCLLIKGDHQEVNKGTLKAVLEQGAGHVSHWVSIVCYFILQLSEGSWNKVWGLPGAFFPLHLSQRRKQCLWGKLHFSPSDRLSFFILLSAEIIFQQLRTDTHTCTHTHPHTHTYAVRASHSLNVSIPIMAPGVRFFHLLFFFQHSV